jgi:hypothetical protein
MFPNIEAKKRGLAIGEGIVLVGSAGDFELAIVDNQPSPTTAKTTYASRSKLFFESRKAPEGAVNCFAQSASRFAAAIGGKHLPEKVVVEMTAAIVANGIANVFGDGIQILDNFFNALVRPFRAINGFIEVGDVSGMMLFIVDFHRVRADVGGEGILGIGESDLFKSHQITPCLNWKS